MRCVAVTLLGLASACGAVSPGNPAAPAGTALDADPAAGAPGPDASSAAGPVAEPVDGAALRRELLRRLAEDQAIRELVASKTAPGTAMDPDDAARWEAIDAGNTAWLAQVVERHGWPGRSLVGADGARAAFLLAQHADQAHAFQERMLVLLGEAVAAGEAEPSHLAYLTDRVRTHAGRPQVYGTQVDWSDGTPRPYPLEEPDRVDELRAEVGLGPLAEYLAGFGAADDD